MRRYGRSWFAAFNEGNKALPIGLVKNQLQFFAFRSEGVDYDTSHAQQPVPYSLLGAQRVDAVEGYGRGFAAQHSMGEDEVPVLDIVFFREISHCRQNQRSAYQYPYAYGYCYQSVAAIDSKVGKIVNENRAEQSFHHLYKNNKEGGRTHPLRHREISHGYLRVFRWWLFWFAGLFLPTGPGLILTRASAPRFPHPVSIGRNVLKL